MIRVLIALAAASIAFSITASATASLEIRSNVRPPGAATIGNAKRTLDKYIASPSAGRRDQPIDCYYSLSAAICRGHYKMDRGAWRCSVRAEIFNPGIVRSVRNYCVYTRTFDDDDDDDPHSGSGWDRPTAPSP